MSSRYTLGAALFCAAKLSLVSTVHAMLDERPWGAPDGISDVWAFRHGFGQEAVSSTADPDGDGLTNAQEALAGTDPRSALSRPYVGLEMSSTTAARITGPAQLGKRYQLQRATALAPANWQTFATLDATGTTLSADTSQSGARNYYRALVGDSDTDGDGLTDWEELAVGFDPRVVRSFREWDDDRTRLGWLLWQTDEVLLTAMAVESAEAWPLPMTVAVRRKQGFGPLTLTLNVAGTAARGADYASSLVAGNNTLTFAANENEKRFTFTPLADTANAESAETILLTLSVAAPATIPSGFSTATLTIQNSTPTSLPPLPAATRFLQQATFGPDEASLQDVMTRGYAGWITNEISKPNLGRISPWVNRQNNRTPGATNYQPQTPEYPNNAVIDAYHKQVGMWNAIMGRLDAQDPAVVASGGAPSLLRQRLAYALSQIVVISERQSDLGFHPEGMANYWDMLLANALGNYRTLLEDVTLHPCMGVYLSHFKNQKANPAANLYPDENYAREILQLFSIGLWELNADGTRRLDALGNPIPTYGNAQITEFARVFTGFSWARDINRNGDTGAVVVSTATSFDTYGWGDYLNPMKMFDDRHDFAAKQLLAYPGAVNGGLLAARADTATAAEGLLNLDFALDNIFNHPNVPPFIARRLIQQLVSSNPSPAYVQRVATAFATGLHAGVGSGQRGDLAATVRAILLDDEARLYAQLSATTHGRLQEPFVRTTQLVRFFETNSPNGGFPFYVSYLRFTGIQQEPFTSPSVFNFYLPDHRPTGVLAQAGLYGPEFQMVNSSTAVGLPNQLFWWSYGLNSSTAWGAANYLTFDMTYEKSIAHDADALIRYLDERLTGRRLTPEEFAIVRRCVERYNWPSVDESREERVRVAYYMILLSPSGAVLK
jgi:uncharacterized protein (DUF1800 family)